MRLMLSTETKRESRNFKNVYERRSHTYPQGSCWDLPKNKELLNNFVISEAISKSLGILIQKHEFVETIVRICSCHSYGVYVYPHAK